MVPLELREYKVHIGIMEKKMETTSEGLGFRALNPKPIPYISCMLWGVWVSQKAGIAPLYP